MNQEKEGPSDNAAVQGWTDASRACTRAVRNVQSTAAQTCIKVLSLFRFLSHPRWILLSCLGYKTNWHDLLYLILVIYILKDTAL